MLTLACGVMTTTVVFMPQTPVVVYAEGEEETSEPVLDTSEQEPEVEEPAPTEEENEEVDAVSQFFADYFSADKVAMYMSWIAYIATIIGLVVKLRQLKQTNNFTLKGVSDEVQAKLEIVVGQEVAKQFGEIAPKLISGQENTNQIMTIFAKILALSQENTPESRVAILNLIEQLGTVGQELVNNAKGAIEESVKLAEQAKKELDERVDKIIDNYEEPDNYDGTSI